MTEKPIFTGAATALVTPFCSNGIDYKSFGRLLDFQLENGIDALVVCGTTGEAPTLTRAERRKIVAFAAERINGRVPLIAGAGCNDTEKAKKFAADARAAGADALLLVTPYYNKCTADGLVKYYAEVSASGGLPFIAYSVPSRTGVRISPETAAKIASLPLSAGLKDCGDVAGTARILAACGRGFPVYCGSDPLILPVLSLGGAGAISVLANVRPAEVRGLCRLFEKGEIKAAAELQTKLLPLADALFSEVNPIPVKAALCGMGLCKNLLRAPLTPLSKQHEKPLFELL
ncbi:MAG: 4-hydroxy-tetrahydrodipicolinate synthase [Clostridia bacterium]|nr:4-hydroxy-tetrahydrodipicolinate synthase [Clostridia bacterium]